MEDQGQTTPVWRRDLSVREQIQITHANDYASNYADAGVPGHGQFLLIAKLAAKLDDLEHKMSNQEP